jgi:mono/diheme cytochrome c family protein
MPRRLLLPLILLLTLAGGHKSAQGLRAESPAPARTSGPLIDKGDLLGVGRRLPDVAFKTIEGKSLSLSEASGARGLVVVCTSLTCPVSKRYLPSLHALAAELSAQGLTLVVVDPMPSESPEELGRRLTELGLKAVAVHDRENTLTGALAARTTTEAFLIDRALTLRYRGAIDDQYGVDYNRERPATTFLLNAVRELVAGRPVSVPATTAPGCELDTPRAPAATGPVTYHRDIARILQDHCVRCHREGGVAPFALDNPESVLERAKTLRRVVREGVMPPWFAAPPAAGQPNPWANDCSLSARDKTDLLTWLESSDRPLGNPAEGPAPLKFDPDWSIGRPDAILPLRRSFEIKAEGYIPYQFDTVTTSFPEDKWVTAYEILPSAREVVHHVIVQMLPPGDESKMRAAETYWAAYVPGNGGVVYEPGVARKLPAGARLRFQIHYTPSGRTVTDHMRVGLVFAKEPPRFELKTTGVANTKLSIPPNTPDHVETRSQRIPYDILATALLPHMHVRGKAFRYELTHPDGRKETLLDIPRYDFNWQLRYAFREPKLLPKGSTLTIIATFDNSTGNKANPDPTKTVRWGEQTYQEMMIGYVETLTPTSR